LPLGKKNSVRPNTREGVKNRLATKGRMKGGGGTGLGAQNVEGCLIEGHKRCGGLGTYRVDHTSEHEGDLKGPWGLE